MKIKELHIRNIASIEKADIDFEHDLNDSVTNEPSGIFLISGDTGTGKTVILDAISMALYKKTPRVEDVANKKNNDYKDSEGQSVSINSIEQYTRLGILEKDPCYSELVFEGNDGTEYRARLELGIIKSNTDANGNRPLKHRSPKWTYKKGTEDWQRVDARGQVLIDAVGLNFEQFGRMAMLAQGEFATFLTGDKSERETILEQLTNTSKFTVYGKVISNLYASAKANRSSAQNVYDAEKEHTLPAEELLTLANNLKLLEKQKEAIDTEYNKEKDRLQVLQDIAEWTNVQSRKEAEKARLESLITTDDYQQKKMLVNDWDATNQERQLIISKQQAEARKTIAMDKIAEARESFLRLSSDLMFRDEAIAEKKEEHSQLLAWINDRIAFDELWSNVVAVNLQLEQYKDNITKLNEVKLKLLQEEERTPSLRDKVDVCAKAEKQAKDAATTKQEIIIRLQNELNAFNPQKIRIEKDLAHSRKTDLEKLLDRIKSLNEMYHTQDLNKREIENEEAQLAQLQEAYTKSQHVYEERAKNEASIRSLLSTMQMSLEDTLTELRRKMQNSHADVCPLCGQPIVDLHVSEDFQHILTPLQHREEESKFLLDAASTQRDADKTLFDKAKGALMAKKTELEKDFTFITKEERIVQSQVVTLRLNQNEDLEPQIDEEITKLNHRITELDTLLSKAEDLQEAINQQLDEKAALEEAVKKAERALQDASNDEVNNRNRIIEQEKTLESYEEGCIRLTEILNTRLSSYSPTWQEDVTSVQMQLNADAEIYLVKKKLADNLWQELGKIEAQQKTLHNICSRILQKQTTWIPSDEAVEYKTFNINDEWTLLYAQIEHLHEVYKEAERAQKEATASLALYYAFSCKSEQCLLELIAQEKNVAEARKYVSEIDSDFKSCVDAINHAVTTITEMLKSIKVENLEDLQSVDVQKALVDKLSMEQLSMAGKIGGIEEKLKINSVNEQKFAEAKRELDKSIAIYDKWDRMNKCFGGTRFRTLVQTHILRPLLNNANIYLEKISDRYTLTCSEDNEQLSILVLDRYNKNQVRSVTVLSGGERFMISLALSLALSSLNRQDMNANILFIDEGFGTLDETNLNSVMTTLEKLQEIAGQNNRRVGIISHREELADRIAIKINVKKKGEGRSIVEITKE